MTYYIEHRRELVFRHAEYTGGCCPWHTRYQNLPCCHLLRDGFQEQLKKNFRLRLKDFLDAGFAGAPVLALRDAPHRWHRLLAGRLVSVEAPAPFVPLAKAPFSFAGAETFLEQVIDRAWHSPALLREISRLKGRMQNLLGEEPSVHPPFLVNSYLIPMTDMPMESLGVLAPAPVILRCVVAQGPPTARPVWHSPIGRRRPKR